MNAFRIHYTDGTHLDTSANGTAEEFLTYLQQGPYVTEDASGKETRHYVESVEEIKTAADFKTLLLNE